MNKDYVLKSRNMYIYFVGMYEGIVEKIEFTTDKEQADKYNDDFSLTALINLIKAYLNIEIEKEVYDDNKE